MFNTVLIKKIKFLFFASLIFSFINTACGLKNDPKPPVKSLVK